MKSIEVISGYSEEVLQDILFLERNSFPPELVYPDAKDYYKASLENARNICLFLREEKKRIGYLMAMPHNDAVNELKDDDPEMIENTCQYYIETLQILPAHRGGFGLLIMIRGLKRELMRMGIRRISFHARKVTKLGTTIQNIFPLVTTLRTVDNWLGSTESVDYFEVQF